MMRTTCVLPNRGIGVRVLPHSQPKPLGQGNSPQDALSVSESSMDVFIVPPVGFVRPDTIENRAHRIVDKLCHTPKPPTALDRWPERLRGAYRASQGGLSTSSCGLDSLEESERALPEGSTHRRELPVPPTFVRDSSFLHIVPGFIPLVLVRRGLVVTSSAGAQTGDSVSHAPVRVCGALKASDDSLNSLSALQPTSPTGGHL
jgi:hypothetical protein